MTAVIASTVTIMIVFLPLLLIQGQSGQMFTQLALVVISLSPVSLLDAITVVPMLASRLIKAEDYEHGEEGIGKERPYHYGPVLPLVGTQVSGARHSYRNGLQWSLGHRWLVVGGAFGACA
jgi:HAE1 family hydrophobic/amphiphilic exporter-1